jgi:hypothetical protein
MNYKQTLLAYLPYILKIVKISPAAVEQVNVAVTSRTCIWNVTG